MYTKLFFVLMVFVFIHPLNNKAQINISPDSLKKHVYTLAADSLEGRGFGTNQEAREYIIKQFEFAGLQPLLANYEQHFSQRIGIIRVNGTNIAALIEGADSTLKNEYVLLGAHYDHLGYFNKSNKKVVYNGADDNASGVAGIIEIGKFIAANKKDLKRSVIIVAFDGEESGLLGSEYFTRDSLVNIDNIKIMFSLDMIGMYSEKNGLQLLGMGLMNEKNEFLKKLNTDINIEKTSSRIPSRTDTKPFGVKEIPSIHVFTGTKSPYHKPNDDSELLNYEGMAHVCNYIAEATIELANCEKIEPSKKLQASLKADNSPIKIGFTLNVGNSYFAYKNEFYDGKSIFSAETGVLAKIKLTERKTLQAELLLASYGGQTTNKSARINSLTIPVNMLFSLNKPKPYEPQINFSLGAYYANNLWGKENTTDINFSNYYTKTEYGVSIGLNMYIEGVQIGYYKRIGLKDVFLTQNGNIIPERSYFSMAYIF